MLLGLTLLSNGMIDWAIEICEMNSSNNYVYETNVEENTCCCDDPSMPDCCRTTYFYYFTPKFIENNESLKFVNPELTLTCNYFSIHLNEDNSKFTFYQNRWNRNLDRWRWRLRSFEKQEVKCVWII